MFIINISWSNYNENLDTDRKTCSKYFLKKMSSSLNKKILNSLIKKKNLPIIKIKIVKYMNDIFLY